METWTNSTTAAVDEKLGIIAIMLPFVVEPLNTKIETLVRALTFRPPEIGGIGLPLIKRDVKERGDGGYDVGFYFDGKFDPNEPGEEFSLEGSTSEDPIESFPYLQYLIETYNGDRKDDGKVIFPLTMEVDDEEVQNPMHGVSSYLVSGIVWTHTFVCKEFPEWIVRGLGVIDTPAVGPSGQKPPQLHGKRNWLRIRATATYRGNVWKVVISWLLSGPGGWNPDIYRYR